MKHKSANATSVFLAPSHKPSTRTVGVPYLGNIFLHKRQDAQDSQKAKLRRRWILQRQKRRRQTILFTYKAKLILHGTYIAQPCNIEKLDLIYEGNRWIQSLTLGTIYYHQTDTTIYKIDLLLAIAVVFVVSFVP